MTAKAGRRPKRDSRDIPRPPAAQLVWEKRNELGYTQNYVAEMIGAPQTWMTKYETGRIRFGSPTRMRALARLLNIDYEELVLRSGLVDRWDTAGKFAAQLPTEQRALLDAAHARLDPLLVQLDQRQLDRVVEYVKDRIQMMQEAAEARRAYDPDPDPNGSTPQQSPLRQERTAPDPASPESSAQGCGR